MCVHERLLRTVSHLKIGRDLGTDVYHRDPLTALTRQKAVGTAILFFLVVAYPIPSMFQGLDWTDQGHWASLYQGVFRYPESVSSNFTCWLTVMIGGLWMQLTGFLGLIGVRLGYVIATSSTALLLFATLRRAYELPVWAILIVVFAATSYANADLLGAMNWLSYNDLTALFYVWAAYHLVRGLKEERSSHIAAAGAILAANLFIRLPNVLGAFLVVAVFFHGLMLKQSIRQIARNASVFAVGYLGGVATIVVLMASLGHLGLYLRAVQDLLHYAATSETHGITNIVETPLRDNLLSIQAAIYLLVVAALLYTVGRMVGRFHLLIVLFLAVATGAFIATHDIPFLSNFARAHIRGGLWSHAGLAYLCLAALIVLPLPGVGDFPIRRTLALVALLIALLVPLGSSRSLYNEHYGMWLAIGAIGAYLFSRRGGDRSWLFLQSACTVAVAVYGALVLWFFPYRDTQDRTQLRYGVSHPKLRGILTHQSRARTIEEFLAAAPNYVHPGSWVIAFEYIPMIHYLTETRPYLYNPNPMYYTADEFGVALSRAGRESSALPVIISAKGPADNDWPDDVSKGVETNLQKFAMMRSLIDEFKAQHGYQKAWENNFFAIWTPAPTFGRVY